MYPCISKVVLKHKYPVELFDLFQKRLRWFIVMSYQVNPSAKNGVDLSGRGSVSLFSFV